MVLQYVNKNQAGDFSQALPQTTKEITMAMLRDSIKAKIREANGDVEAAAIAVCQLLEDLISCDEKGYFADDPAMREIIAASRTQD